MSEVLADSTVAELSRALHARETTAQELTEAHLARIGAWDERVHAFMRVDGDGARAAAREADARLAAGRGGPLTGVPVAVKDMLAVRGCVRGNGSPAFADDPPATADATAVARLRAAGAVILGTTHMHELAFGPTGVNPALGTPLNPWNADRVPGGSSSGSGSAVAARLVPAALGSDTGGSIRIPATFCGVCGLKATYGRVSRAGATVLAWSLDHVGALARSVEDLALLFQVLAGHDPADPSSARLPVPDYTAGLGRSLHGVRVGVLRQCATGVIDPDVARAFETAIGDLGRAGAALRDVAVPALAHAEPAVGAVILSEANVALRAALGDRVERIGMDVRVYLELGRVVSAESYLAAQRFRTRLYDEMRAVLASVDVLALPTTILPAPGVGDLQIELGGTPVGAIEAIGRMTGPFNLTGLPALAVPCGFSSGGGPLGLQLVGRPFEEAGLLAIGHGYQAVTDWHRRRPPL
jgi:aspartyl-tRNA(Asn)/glutamyl-tRNA(Gln) amidotransferase subunit A